MKILPAELTGAKNIQTKKSGKSSAPVQSKSDGTGSVQKSDSVQISGAAGQMQGMSTVMKDLPVVRADQVAKLKSEIENGTYNPSAESIADSMIQVVQQMG